MKRTAKAHWSGTIREGKGNLTTPSEILNQANYSFRTRFADDEKGTNPEELLAAAHAGCFTMAVSLALTEKGLSPESLDTVASLTLQGFDITGIHLAITGKVAGVSAEEFEQITRVAEKNCLISKALKIEITSEASLVNA